jgi:hypothetical protein
MTAGVIANFLKIYNHAISKLIIPLGNFNKKKSLLYIGNLTSFTEHILSGEFQSGRYFLVMKKMCPVRIDRNSSSNTDRGSMICISPWLIRFVLKLISKEELYNKLDS